MVAICCPTLAPDANLPSDIGGDLQSNLPSKGFSGDVLQHALGLAISSVTLRRIGEEITSISPHELGARGPNDRLILERSSKFILAPDSTYEQALHALSEIGEYAQSRGAQVNLVEDAGSRSMQCRSIDLSISCSRGAELVDEAAIIGQRAGDVGWTYYRSRSFDASFSHHEEILRIRFHDVSDAAAFLHAQRAGGSSSM